MRWALPLVVTLAHMLRHAIGAVVRPVSAAAVSRLL
jgi:hypothetical protein